MIKSMTGYGTATLESEAGRSYRIEIKSVNHRHCDVHVKLPGKLSFLEHEMKKVIKARFERGRFDLYLSLDEFGEKVKMITFDKDLAATYLKMLQELGRALNLDTQVDLLSLTRLPDVLRVEQAELNEEEIKAEIEQALQHALEHLEQMRIHEGEILEKDVVTHLENIRAFVEAIARNAEKTPVHYKEVLEERIKRLTENVVEIDEERLSQEVAIFADRIDISEEVTRLNGHIEHFLHLLKEPHAVGRKLDFLVQEMNREINTIGSKSNNADISKQVVEIKAVLEKIREQIQNVE